MHDTFQSFTVSIAKLEDKHRTCVQAEAHPLKLSQMILRVRLYKEEIVDS